MIELRINGEKLDIRSERIELQEAPASLIELDEKVGLYSNTFNLPRTSKNQRLLGFPFHSDSATRKPYIRISAELWNDGSRLYFGFLQVNRSTKDVFECNFLGTNSKWISKVKDKSLRDLDLSRWNHTWNTASIEHYSGATSPTPQAIVYPSVDYGLLNAFDSAGANQKTTVPLQYPAVYVKDIFEQVFTDVGIAIDYSRFRNTTAWEEYRRLVVPFSGSDVPRVPLDKLITAQVAEQTSANITVDLGSIPAGTPETVFVIDVPVEQVEGGWNTDSLFDGSGNSYGYVDIEGAAIVRSLPLAFLPGITGLVWRVKNGGTTVFSEVKNTQSSIFDYFEINKKRIVVDLTKTVQIEFRLIILNPPETLDWYVDFGNSNFKSKFTVYAIKDGVPPIDQLYPNMNWDVARNLPDMKQTDFVKAIANHFLFTLYDNDDILGIRRYEDLARDKSSAPDWSNKLDIISENETTYRLESLFQRTQFVYPKDTEPADVGIIPVPDEWLQAEGVIYESAFAASAQNELDRNSDRFFPSILTIPMLTLKEGVVFYFYDNGIDFEVGDFTVNKDGFYKCDVAHTSGATLDKDLFRFVLNYDDFAEVQEVEPRIAYVEVREYGLVSEGVGLARFPMFFGGEKDALPLQWTAIHNRHYKAYRTTVDGLRLNKAYIIYNQADLMNLDFLKPVKIEAARFGLSGYYYLNALTSYQPGTQRTAEFELIKIKI